MSHETPLRPDASAAMRRARSPRRWLPAIAVLAIVLATTFGGFVVSAVSSESTGPPVSIDGVVSVQPLSGWEPAEVGSLADRPTVGLTRGSGTLAVLSWGPSIGGSEGLAVEVGKTLPGSLDQLTVSELLTPVAIDQGLSGHRFTFVGIDRSSGAALEGEVTTIVTAGGDGVVFVGLAPEGLLAFVDGDLHTMIAAAAVGSGR